MSKMNVEEIFAENVFTLGKMKERLPRKVFQEVKRVMECGGELSLSAADCIPDFLLRSVPMEHGTSGKRRQ